MRDDGDGRSGMIATLRPPVDQVTDGDGQTAIDRVELTEVEQQLLADLFAIVEEHADQAAVEVDR